MKSIITFSFSMQRGCLIMCTLFLAPEGTYKNGVRSVFAEIMRESGPKGLFKGLTPVIIRAFPANAVSNPKSIFIISQEIFYYMDPVPCPQILPQIYQIPVMA